MTEAGEIVEFSFGPLPRLPWRRSREIERRFNLLWGDLAQYNADKCRGLKFTPEHVERMAWKQARYNAVLRAGGDLWNPSALSGANHHELCSTSYDMECDNLDCDG